MPSSAKEKRFGWPEGTCSLLIPGQTRIIATPSATGHGAWQLQIGNEIIVASPSSLKMLAAFVTMLANSERSRSRGAQATRAHLAAEKNQPRESEGKTCSECGGDGAVGKPALCWPCRSTKTSQEAE